MKIVKNAILSLAVVLGAISFADAQMMRAGIHVTPSLPMGDFGSDPSADDPDGLGAGFGIGGNIFANYFLNENFHAGIEVGYQTYGWEQDNGAGGTLSGNFNIIPLQLTAAYHTDAEAILDIYFGAGVGLFMIDATMDDVDFDVDTESPLGFTPRIGVSYELTDALRFDGNVAFAYILDSQETSTETVAGVEFETTTGYPALTTLNINLGISFLLFD